MGHLGLRVRMTVLNACQALSHQQGGITSCHFVRVSGAVSKLHSYFTDENNLRLFFNMKKIVLIKKRGGGQYSGICVCVLSHFSHGWLFATLWTVVRQAPLCMGLSRQECWNALPFPPPGSSWPRDWMHVSYVFCIGRRVLYHWATWEAHSSIYTMGQFIHAK